MQRRHHYEQAFEAYLRANRIPYVAVDEARKALLPESAKLRVSEGGDPATDRALKSFDLVVYAPSSVVGDPGEASNLLVDIKGRKVAQRKGQAPLSPGRLESWVTEDDIASQIAGRPVDHHRPSRPIDNVGPDDSRSLAINAEPQSAIIDMIGHDIGTAGIGDGGHRRLDRERRARLRRVPRGGLDPVY